MPTEYTFKSKPHLNCFGSSESIQVKLTLQTRCDDETENETILEGSSNITILRRIVYKDPEFSVFANSGAQIILFLIELSAPCLGYASSEEDDDSHPTLILSGSGKCKYHLRRWHDPVVTDDDNSIIIPVEVAPNHEEMQPNNTSCQSPVYIRRKEGESSENDNMFDLLKIDSEKCELYYTPIANVEGESLLQHCCTFVESVLVDETQTTEGTQGDTNKK